MGMHEWFKKNKHDLLPWVKDWTSPQNHIRYEKKIFQNLTRQEWLWCHPSAYIYYSYGSVFLSLLSFMALTIYLFMIDHNVSAVLTIIPCFALGYDLYKKLKNWKLTKEVTLYDLYMREFPELEVK